MQLSCCFGIAAFTASVASVPSGCSTSYNGDFQITVVKPMVKRSLMTRDSTCGKDGYLTLKLHDGNLIDSKGRLGYIASNYQFQFDNPPQENAASVGGYSVCQNGSLALAGSTIFYQCLSGDFYNLYDRSWAAQCQPIHIDLLPCNTGTITSHNPSPVSQIGDGQPQAPSATTRIPVSQISDGQPQAPTATPRIPISQISDGQPQAPAATPKAPTPQKSDGQPQVPVATPGVSTPQIPAGQPQVPAATTHTATTMTQTKPSVITHSSMVNTQTSEPPVASNTITPISAGGGLNKVSSFGAFVIAAAAASFFL